MYSVVVGGVGGVVGGSVPTSGNVVSTKKRMFKTIARWEMATCKYFEIKQLRAGFKRYQLNFKKNHWTQIAAIVQFYES